MSATSAPASRPAAPVRFLVRGALALLLVCLLAMGSWGTVFAAGPPNPAVSVGLEADALLGTEIVADVTFGNASTSDTGYGPYIDLRLPLGEDGDDGLTFTSATYLGVPVSATELTANPAGCVTHPFAVDTTGAPRQVCGMTPGQALVVLRLPFGSVTPDQPAIPVRVALAMSPFADAGLPLAVTASGGFQYGATALADPATDPSIIGGATTASVTPTILRLVKVYDGAEDETATGPNFPRTYTIEAQVAPGQTVTDLVLADALPDTIQFESLEAASPVSTAVSTPSTAVPGGTLAREYASVTGGAGPDAAFTFRFHVPVLDAAGDSVLDPASGAATTSTDSATATAAWDPQDPRDGAGPVDAGPATHVLTDRSIAIQKSVALAQGGDVSPVGTVNPGDVLEWTLAVQVSDAFAFDNVRVHDRLLDGSRLDGTFVPTLAVTGNGYALPATPFAPANATLGTADSGTGITQSVFRLSDEVAARGESPQIVGGCVNPAGGTAVADCDSPDNDGATTATIVFRSIVQDTWVDGERIVEGDSLVNLASVTGDVLETATLTPTGTTAGDGTDAVATPGSGASVGIPQSTMVKSIYAVNGMTGVAAPIHVGPGDTVTFRITQTFPTSRIDDLVITDYLPLPVFAAGEITAFDRTVGAAAPPAGTVQLGPADTFHALLPAPRSPGLSTDPVSNELVLSYGDYAAPAPGTPSIADLLFTVTVRNDPFADGLFLTNIARTESRNTVDQAIVTDSIVQLVLDQPVLDVTKGIVGSDAPGAILTPAAAGPVTFDAPGAASCQSWSGGPITPAGLDATPIDSGLTGVDAGDLVRFAITVRNTGHRGAYDVVVADDLPVGFSVPAGGLNLCVSRGDGTAPVVANAGGGTGLFDTGLLLTGSGGTRAIAAGVDAGGTPEPDGASVIVVTFDLAVAAAARPGASIVNTASLTRYANATAGSNHLAAPLRDPAVTSLDLPAVTKDATGSDQVHTTPPAVAIGEVVTYEVLVTVPEGTTGPATLTDTLPAGLAFVACDAITASPGLETSLTGGFPAACNDPVNPGISPVSGAGGGLVATYDLGTLVNTNRDDATAETLTVRYRVVVTNVAANARGALRQNRAVLTWDDGTAGRSAEDAADAVRVVEPRLTVVKTVSPTSGDANDLLTYDIVVANPANADGAVAFGVALSDAIPSGVTYVAASLTTTAGTAPDSLSESGGTISAAWASYDPGATTTIRYQATVNSGVTPGQGITNLATATWSSLPGTVGPQSPYNTVSAERTGSPSDPGAAANTYLASDPATFTVAALAPVKSRVATSEASSTNANVVIGEIIRYRLVILVPEGSTPALALTDRLPTGLSYLAGTARLALVSTSGGLTSSTFGTPAGLAQAGDQSNLASITPTWPVPAGAVTGGVGDGDDPVFALGTLTNVESDANSEYVVLEFNALVVNTVGNSAGNPAGLNRDNDFQVRTSGVLAGTSNSIRVTVRHPALDVVKTATVVPGDAGDAIRYMITATNTGRATAFDTRITDTLDDDLVMGAVGITLAGSASGATDLSNAGTRLVDVRVDAIPVAGSVTVIVDAVVADDAEAGRTISNIAIGTWTSLPGAGTASNPTGSVTPGTQGSGTGERDGSGGVNGYTDPGNASVSLTAPGIEKLPVSPSDVPIGAEPEFTLRVRVPEGITRGLSVTDTLPSGLEVIGHVVVFTAAASDGNLTADYAGTPPVATVTASPSGSAGGALTLAFGDLANLPNGDPDDDSFLVVVSTRVANVGDNQAGTRLVNAASLAFIDPETGVTTVPAPATRTVTVVEPVVTARKSADPTTPEFGSVVTYTLVVDNVAPASTADAHELALSDTLPTGLTYVPGSLEVEDGAVPTAFGESDGTITATWDTLPLGGSTTLTYRATVGGPGEVSLGDVLVNRVEAAWTSLPGVVTGERTGDDGPSGLLDDYAAVDDAPVTVGGVDLAITKTDGEDVATAGETLVYALEVTNTGNLEATGVVVSETVPAHTTFRAGPSTAGWSCATGDPAGTPCTLAIGTLGAGANASVTFAVRVDAPLPPLVPRVLNIATVADDGTHGPNPDDTDDIARDTDTVPAADLSLAKSVDETAPNVGDEVEFTVTVTNDGPDAASGVEVADPLPAGLAFASASASQGTYDQASGTWTVGTLAVAATATLQVTAEVTGPGTATNVAEVSAAGSSDIDSTPGNGDPGEDDLDAASLTPRIADLAVDKTVDVALPDPGDTVVFTIALSNLGPDPATGVALADVLPTGLTFVAATPSQGTYDQGTGTWSVGAVPVGTRVATLDIEALVAAPGAIVNTAAIAASDVYDPDSSNDSDDATIDQLVDLVVVKSVDEPAQDVGEDVEFTITVLNDGPNDATGVVIADVLPAGLDYRTHTGDGTYVPGTGAWTVGDVPDGVTATLRVTATVTAVGPLTNMAAVDAVDQPQSDTSNDSDDATVTPPRADIVVVKTVSDSRPAVGETVTWTITVTNSGPDTAQGVFVTDTLPGGLLLLAATPSQGTFDEAAGEWTVGSLALDATATLGLETRVTALGDRTNTASATADTWDPDPDNNSDDAFLTTRQADIAVTKSVDDATPDVGDIVTFTISATNNGPDPARDVVVRDRLPAGLAYVSDDGAGDYDPATGDWAVGDLAVLASRSLAIDARVIDSGATTNTARLHGLVEEDTDPDNDEGSASIDAPPAADLRLAKSADPARVANGQEVVFMLEITNDGPDPTTDVAVVDRLPTGLEYVSDDGGGAYDAAAGTWTVGAMGVDETARLRITATVTVPGELVNTAEVTGSSLPDPDSVPGNGDPVEDDQAQAVLNADNRADLSLTKTANATRVEIGDPVTYTLTVRNAGPDRATGVVVRDELPAGVTYLRHRGGLYDPGSGAWDVGTLEVGQARTLRITVLVGKLGNHVNRAEIVASDAFDPDSAPGNGSRDEDDGDVAAIGGLAPSMPPTSTDGTTGARSAGGHDLGLLLPVLISLATVSLLARPFSARRRG